MTDTSRGFDSLFDPRSIAFVGASRDPVKWGFRVLSNIVHGGYRGRIYPINPREKEILGLEVYASIEQLPDIPDLAIVVVPPGNVPPVVEECARKGIKAAVIITAGFSEVGSDGERLQEEMARIARQAGMVVVGPNCQGIMSTGCELYALMPPLFPKPGPLAIVSQSGVVAHTVAAQCVSRGFGVSKYISTGNEAVVHCGEFLEYLAGDPETKVILCYTEGLGDGARFLEAAKRVTRKKPVVMLKAGGTAAGAKAAKSHTASLSGSDPIFDGVCRQAGIIRVADMDQLYYIGIAVAHGIMPKGKRVGIVTAGGGWGVLAADACTRAGLEVAELDEETIAELDSFLPAWWSRANPVDLVAGLRPRDVWKSLETLLRCPGIDGIILLGLVPALPKQFNWSDPHFRDKEGEAKEALETIGDVVDRIMGLAENHGKPIIVASDLPFDGPYFKVDMLQRIGERGGICHTLPDHAVDVFASLARYAEYLTEVSSVTEATSRCTGR